MFAASTYFLVTLLMSLEGNRLQTESCRIYIKIFVCNKEYIVFLCSPEASKSRKDNKFLSKDDISKFCNEITENPAGNVPVQPI